MFCKIFKSKRPEYLLKLIPEKTSSYVTRNGDNIFLFNVEHNFDKNSFFPSTFIEWNNLDSNFRNSEHFGIFKKSIVKFIRSKRNSFYNCCSLKGIRLITRLHLELSHLQLRSKFKYNFQNCLNPLCSCDWSIELTFYFPLLCPIFDNKRHTLLAS